MFVGRTKEINEIKTILDRDEKNAILIYGRRRIGKSFLIDEILKSYTCKIVYYECVNASLEENLMYFENRIRSVFNNRFLHFESFDDAFQFLNTSESKVIVVLDEYSYLKSNREKYYVDSVFQRIIDQMRGNIHLILLGSYVSVMKELLEKEDPLFGRFSLILHLRALDYFDSSAFYHSKTVREKIMFYSVFGGNPFANAELDHTTDLRENIIRLIINPNSAVRSYLENILLSELTKAGPANMILSALANGKKKYTEIGSRIQSDVAGALDKQLKNLIQMDVISKKCPVNKPDDRKKYYYEISDNLVRFYYSYIFANGDIIRRIGENAFYDLMISPTLDTFISYRFEGIAREYFQKLVQNGIVTGVYDIGTYWYDDPAERKNGEFDCVLKHQMNYSFYEVKFYRHPLEKSICMKEEEEIRRLSGNMDIAKIGFISASGFAFDSEEYDLIPAEQLYSF